MRISIITVCYNSENTIRDTIESVLSQTYKDIEYIVIDGASKDATLSIINEYSDRICKIISEPDRGIYDAMNKGITLATGDVIGILNSDDVFSNTVVISSVVEAFLEHPANDIIFGDVVFVQSNDFNKICRHYYAGHFRPWKLMFGWMPPHPGTYVRRKIYMELGLYKTSFKIAADYEIFVRWLLVNKLCFTWINKVLVKMRLGGISTSGFKSNIILNSEIVRACRENGIYTNLLFVLSKIPFKLLEKLKRPI